MNLTLPPRDRGHQGGDPGGQSRFERIVPGIVRLVGGTDAVAGGVRTTKKPPELSPGGRNEQGRRRSAFERVGALPVFALRGFDAESHLFAERTTYEATYRVGLPLCSFHDLLH